MGSGVMEETLPIPPTASYVQLVALCEKQTRELNDFLFQVQGIVRNEDFSHLKLMVGMIMGNGFMPVLEEIGQKVPELRPKWLNE